MPLIRTTGLHFRVPANILAYMIWLPKYKSKAENSHNKLNVLEQQRCYSLVEQRETSNVIIHPLIIIIGWCAENEAEPKLSAAAVICTTFSFKCCHVEIRWRLGFSRNSPTTAAAVSAGINCRRRLGSTATIPGRMRKKLNLNRSADLLQRLRPSYMCCVLCCLRV